MDRTALPVKLQPSTLRPFAYRILSKKHGLNVQTDALKILTETISARFGSDWKNQNSQSLLEDIAKLWKSQDRGLFIDGQGLSQVLKDISGKSEPALAERSDTLTDVGPANGPSEEEINWKDFFKVINPPQQPNYRFDRQRKQFSLEKPTTLSDAVTTNISYFNNRYHLLADRLSRNENFQKSSLASFSAATHSVQLTEITLIKNVLGRDGSKFILFGLLSKNANGDYILEDATDHIELNLSQAHKTEGSYYCSGMFVVVEGIYSASGGTLSSANLIGGCFHVSHIGQPPAERRDLSLENFGNLDFVGINSDTSTKLNKTLKKRLASIEKSLVDHKIVFLGANCFLDDARVLEGLKRLFSTFERDIVDGEKAPLAIVMYGSFISGPMTATSTLISTISNSESYKNNFDEFTSILSKFKYLIQDTKFVMIPGPNDPWQATYSLGSSNLNALPQQPIPSLFASRLERLLPKGNLILAFNPLRLCYLSQEVVMLRDDITPKLKRNDIVFNHDLELEKQRLDRDIEREANGGTISLDTIDTSEQHVSTKVKQARKLVKTLLDQGTLQPFLRDLRLIDTTYDYALRIEPLPSAIVLNDSTFENFDVTYNGTRVVNVGPLMSTTKKINYMEYYPSKKKFIVKEAHY